MMIEMNKVDIQLTALEHCTDVSFCACPGDIVGIIGGSALARTALLRALIGFIPVRGGWVSVDGEPVVAQTAAYYRRKISYVPNCLEFGGEKVSNLIDCCLALKATKNVGLSKDIILDEFRSLSLSVDIASKLFDSLTKAEVQRVAIAIAGGLSRKVMILDNPTSMQDEEGRLVLMSYLCSAKMRQVSIVVATDDPAILSVCNKKIKLNI